MIRGLRVTRRFVLNPLALMVAVGGVLAAHAYNISLKGPVHERLTRLAELCSQQSPMPDRCAFSPRLLAQTDWKAGQYWRAVRWPDDPTDQGNLAGGLKFAVSAGLGRCKDYLGPGKPFAGLTCNSHYGAYQFMHAMASRAGEKPAETRALIHAWAGFAFRVASGETPGAAPYCQAMRALGAPLAGIFAPADFPYCEDRTVHGKLYSAWKVRTLFVLRCHGLFSSRKCQEVIGAKADQLARLHATGALLHLIQDSYSSSHAARAEINPRGPYRPVVDCTPVREFYLYAQNKANHGGADKLPVFQPNCSSNDGTLDPVTASALMLRYINNGPSSQTEALDLIDRQVLGSPRTY